MSFEASAPSALKPGTASPAWTILSFWSYDSCIIAAVDRVRTIRWCDRGTVVAKDATKGSSIREAAERHGAIDPDNRTSPALQLIY